MARRTTAIRLEQEAKHELSSRELAKVEAPPSSDLIEKVLLQGDLRMLSPDQRLAYYKSVCHTLGLNPLTKPFDYITLDNKLVLYARKDCTEQLRRRYGISLVIKSREKTDDVYSVIAQATLPSKRIDESIGAVPLRIFKDGKDHAISPTGLANAIMKAETKAKRRVTLSICGLGLLDETEVETINEYEQLSLTAAAERNVTEATANATQIPGPVASDTVTDANGNVTSSDQIQTADVFDVPETITAENYGELTVHIGKAEGEMLGRKIKELHPNVIIWLYEKWREKLGPSPTRQDARLKQAVEFAYPDVKNPPIDKVIETLRERCSDIVVTEEQACGYLHKQGLAGEGQTSLKDIPENILRYLYDENNWRVLKDVIEEDVKPKADKPKKR